VTGPEIAAELRAHADDLESGRLTWVRGMPREGEACLAWPAAQHNWVRMIRYQDNFVLTKTGLDVLRWNDHECADVSEAVAMLRLAADAAEVGFKP